MLELMGRSCRTQTSEGNCTILQRRHSGATHLVHFQNIVVLSKVGWVVVHILHQDLHRLVHLKEGGVG